MGLLGWLGVGAKLDVPDEQPKPKTVRFWVIQHPQTKRYADIWHFPYMGEEVYGGHHWAQEPRLATKFSTRELAVGWWEHNKRAFGWSQLDDYSMGIADIVRVDGVVEDLHHSRAIWYREILRAAGLEDA